MIKKADRQPRERPCPHGNGLIGLTKPFFAVRCGQTTPLSETDRCDAETDSSKPQTAALAADADVCEETSRRALSFLTICFDGSK